MEVNQDNTANIGLYKLTPVDIDHLFRRSGAKGNQLSLFTYNAEQGATTSPSEYFKELAGSPDLNRVARHLLTPAVKLEFNRGGAASAEETYHAFLSLEDNDVLVQFFDSEDDLLLLLFDNEESFWQWWADIYATNADSIYPAVFPDSLETEVLVCALHAMDIYRRSYMESMLEYKGNLGLDISTADFVDLLKRALASKDKRWLLPTLFEITPGLKGSTIALKPEHLEKAEELGFFSNNENILTLGERSQLMGAEMITSWLGSIGCQATALVNGQEKSLSRIFMTATAFANHIFSFETAAGGGSRFRHQASTMPELIQSLLKWIEALQIVVGGTPPAAVTQAEAPAVKFCGECGTEIRPGKKFCTGCGKPV